MSVIGIDQSLTGTGYAYRGRDGLVVSSLVQKESRGMIRLHNIHNTVVKHADTVGARLAVFEGYAFSFGKNASRSHSLGEVGGILKYALWYRGIDLFIVPPNSLKLFMLGHYKTVEPDKGGKKRKVKVKDLVHIAAQEHAGRTFATNDQADAYSLLLMGEARLNPKLLPRLRDHYKHQAMGGCEFIKGS